MGLMGWGAQPSAPSASAETATYGVDYYRDLFNRKRENLAPIRMALVGKENTGKTGSAIDIALAHTDLPICVIDIDGSADNTVDYLRSTGKGDNIFVVPLIDEADESIWNEDNTTNWLALLDKLQWFLPILSEKAASGELGAVVLDGCSTLLKWCEFVMTDSLLRRGVIKEEGDSFNQKEWRERNRLFKDVLQRVTSLPIPYVFFTFHLKDQKQYMDVGDGTKALMTVGTRPDWVDGTQRFVSQQVFLRRYTQKGDRAAGVEADKSLGADEFVIRAAIEEMKGRNMEHLGKTYDILRVNSGNVHWSGLPLRWD